jgi:hypothetical protein
MAGCSPVVRELSRLPNPDGSVDAVTAIKETDATVATPTEVYVVGHGQPLSHDPVFRADNVDGLSLLWTSDRRLVVHAANARVFLRRATVEVPAPGGSSQIGIDYRFDRETP